LFCFESGIPLAESLFPMPDSWRLYRYALEFARLPEIDDMPQARQRFSLMSTVVWLAI
jgi:hypothetical protein